ncbi:MAG: hypothetical protein MJ244_04385 [Clostridia bacterium]|nr:hypothetical protein [Clostridia bacterium]
MSIEIEKRDLKYYFDKLKNKEIKFQKPKFQKPTKSDRKFLILLYTFSFIVIAFVLGVEKFSNSFAYLFKPTLTISEYLDSFYEERNQDPGYYDSYGKYHAGFTYSTSKKCKYDRFNIKGKVIKKSGRSIYLDSYTTIEIEQLDDKAKENINVGDTVIIYGHDNSYFSNRLGKLIVYDGHYKIVK